MRQTIWLMGSLLLIALFGLQFVKLTAAGHCTKITVKNESAYLAGIDMTVCNDGYFTLDPTEEHCIPWDDADCCANDFALDLDDGFGNLSQRATLFVGTVPLPAPFSHAVVDACSITIY